MATPHLTRLLYGFCINVRPGDRSALHSKHYLDCAKLSTVLSYVKSSLKSLIIRIRFFDEWAVPDEFRGMTGRIVPLRNFESITKLEIPMVMLFGWDPEIDCALPDVLPPKLQILELTDYLAIRRDSHQPDRQWVNFVHLFQNQRINCSPNLKPVLMR